jgi:hypothetical protein
MQSNVIKKLINLLLVVFITTFLFELAYRFYIIDFYKNSFTALNSEKDLNESNLDYLIFGDSFSAINTGYVSLMRNKFPNKSILNFSVPGIGIEQVNLYAENKIKKYDPETIIYQVYVGNDLTDIQNLTNWSDLSFVRNVYWRASDYFLSFKYLNQNFSVFNSKQPIQHLDSNVKFSKECYNKREQLFLQADNKYLDKTITLKAEFELRYQKWKNETRVFLSNISKDKKVYIVFIPHCSQINEFYYSNMVNIGADFNFKKEIINSSYPFFNKAKYDFKDYENVTFLNPIDYLKSRDNNEYRLYFENDPHFNENGHVVFANYISKIINH